MNIGYRREGMRRIVTNRRVAIDYLMGRFGTLLPTAFYDWLLAAPVGDTYTLRDWVNVPETWIMKARRSTRMATRKTTVAAAKKPAAKKADSEGYTIPKFDPSTRYDFAATSSDQEIKKLQAEIDKRKKALVADQAKPINDAIEAAVARFEAEPKAEYAFHLHHTVLAEKITEGGGVKGAVKRIEYIIRGKGLTELLHRFRVMRPIPPDKLKPLITGKTGRILAKDVEAARKAAEKAQNAVYTLEHNPSKARSAAQQAWDKLMTATRKTKNWSYIFVAPTQEQIDPVVKALDAWRDSATAEATHTAELQALKKKLADLKAEYTRLDTEYRNQRYGNSGAGSPPPITEDALWALHTEVCEADCPYTKEHPSVIPARKSK